MANPQPTDPHLRIAHELLEELMSCDFTKRQLGIILLILRLSWGCRGDSDRKHAVIPLQKDFEAAGVGETHIKQELQWLLDAKVIGTDGKRYWFNKDYDQWRVSRSKVFRKKRLEYLIGINIHDLHTGDKPRGHKEHGWVYVLKAPDDLYKIGYTQNLQERLADYKGMPLELSVLLTKESPMAATLELELKRKFKPKQFKGEWFRLSEADIIELTEMVTSKTYQKGKSSRLKSGSPIKRKENTNTIIIDDDTRQAIENLPEKDKELIKFWRGVKGFKLGLGECYQLLVGLKKEHPNLDLLAESKLWAARKLDEPLTKASRPAQQIWNWMRIAKDIQRKRRADNGQTGKGGRYNPKGKDSPSLTTRLKHSVG